MDNQEKIHELNEKISKKKKLIEEIKTFEQLMTDNRCGFQGISFIPSKGYKLDITKENMTNTNSYCFSLINSLKRKIRKEIKIHKKELEGSTTI